ncbi:MAG: GNAT family N-acetyltransferase [Eubacteriales bacterium]|nr:GNAT family N-acetyltransferase [Eubacteriales bacterium]
MSLELKPAYNCKQEIGQLFAEYTEMLISHDSSFEEYLKLQNYEKEIEHLEEKYGVPQGRLYLAYEDGKAAGCIGLRKMDNETCEMKRLYVRPEFRGKHIGNQLIQKIIDDAVQIGYKHMLLDTFPFLKSAVHMYKRFGFYEVECYNDNPMNTAVFMRLDL